MQFLRYDKTRSVEERHCASCRGSCPGRQRSATNTGSNACATGPPRTSAAGFRLAFSLGQCRRSREGLRLRRERKTFAKTGELIAPGKPGFDDSAWTKIDLPHDWAVELPFVNERNLISHGAKPLGREYPETSIGWYRHVFRDSGDRQGPSHLASNSTASFAIRWSSSTATTSAAT